MLNLDKYRSRLKDETGFSMMITLLTLIVLVSIVTSVAFMTVMITQKSAQTRDYSYYTLSADSVTNTVLQLANEQSIPNPVKPSLTITAVSSYVIADSAVRATNGLNNSKVFHGTTQEFTSGEGRDLRYFWYITDVSTAVPHSYYIINVGIYSSATKAKTLSQVKELDKNAYFMKTRVNSFQVVGYTTTEGTVEYKVPTNELYSRGLLGWDNINITGYSKFRSYNSAVTLNPQAVGAVLSENAPITVKGAITFPSNFAALQSANGTTGGNVVLLDKSRGVPSLCHLGSVGNNIGPCPLPSSTFDFPIIQEDMDQHLSQAKACLEGTAPSMNWSTAANGTVFPAGPSAALSNNVLCLDSLEINADTTLNTGIQVAAPGKPGGSISTGNPLYVVVKGNTIISNGAVVNKATSGATGPASLRIYSDSGNLALTSLTSTEPTTLNAIVNVAGACSFSSPASNPAIKTILNGAGICGSVTTSGTFNFNYDSQVAQLPAVASNTTQTTRLYFIASSSPVASL